MADNIYQLYPPQVKIGHFIRHGHTGYRTLENLHAADRLLIKRAVLDASHLENQADLISSLKNSGTELILDPKAAELSFQGGFETKAKNLPWAHKDRPHQPSDFTKRRLVEYCERIAEFAATHQVDVVHSATHVVTEPNDSWLKVDTRAYATLRQVLDRTGGQRIQIDDPLIIPNSILRDEIACNMIIDSLADLPYENLWLRVSGLGMSATPAGLRRYIIGAWKFRRLGKPIIADGVGGLIGLSLTSFGAVGGLCHGIAEKENFNSNNWKKPHKGRGGAKRRIYIPNIDLYLPAEQARVLFQGWGAKSLLACNDTSCCANGIEDMFDQHKAHALIQSTRPASALNQIPEHKWVGYLLDKHLAPAGRKARRVERMKLSDPKLREKLKKRNYHLEGMYQVLEKLYETAEEIPLSIKPVQRHVKFTSFGRMG